MFPWMQTQCRASVVEMKIGKYRIIKDGGKNDDFYRKRKLQIFVGFLKVANI